VLLVKPGNLILSSFIAALLSSCYASRHGGDDTGTDADAGPCPAGTYAYREIPAGGVHVAIDVLLVVDNSGSMAAEQALLAEAFPSLIERLLTGIDPATGNPVHMPVGDLHVGVVSTDMGVGGFSVTTCEENPLHGDDGILQHTPHGTACDSSYPAFLNYQVDTSIGPDPAQIERLSRDFGCIAVLGTQGCGFEQQLEAAYKALAVNSLPGGPNAGFLRDDSILAVLFVTDEEDCSAADPTTFDVSSYPYCICLGCYYQKEKLHPPSRYVEALRALRPDPDDLVVGFITGVPPGSICEGSGDAIAGCLDEPAMQETVRPDAELLEFVCKYPVDCHPPDPPNAGNCLAEAFPGRRYVEVAQNLGPSAVVGSICTGSFAPFLDAVAQKIGSDVVSRTAVDPLPVGKPGADACFCESPCTIVEKLTDGRPCPDYDYDGVPDFGGIDEAGRSLCQIPQSGSILQDCTLPCEDPLASHEKATAVPGWWYDAGGPAVIFEGVEPQEGSSIAMECCS
jgi:hypothetical protein